ncbi:MAG: hypothetical protein KA354_09055 [Phycisphaerae bacterium]|nr:hypothetical protein [Phycisphaerae bacterium]
MNSRERLMIGLLLAAMAVFLGRTGVVLYRNSLRGYDAKIKSLKKDLATIKSEQVRAVVNTDRWRREIGPSTLSMDPNEAMTRLREELYEQTQQARLQDVQISLHQVRSYQKNGIRRLPATVTATAKLNEVVAFLFNLYRQPYQVRCTGLTLGQAIRLTGKEDKRKEEAAQGLLKMTAQLETLILPPSQLAPAVEKAGLDEGKRQEVGRTKLAKLDDYKPLLAKKMFQPYRPEQFAISVSAQPPNAGVVGLVPPMPRYPEGSSVSVNVTPHPGFKFERWEGDLIGSMLPGQLKVDANKTIRAIFSGSPATQPVVVQQPPVPTAPPKDAQMVLGRVLSSPRGQLVVLENPRPQPNAPKVGEDQYKEVGEEVYGGTLVYVHPKGAVTESADGRRHFHELGKALKDCQDLTEDTQPLIYHEVMKLAEQASGIKPSPS